MKFVWTEEKPTKAGWYWFIATGKFPVNTRGEVPLMSHQCRFVPVIVLVNEDRLGCYVQFPQGLWYVKRMPGKWSGPISEPEG